MLFLIMVLVMKGVENNNKTAVIMNIDPLVLFLLIVGVIALIEFALVFPVVSALQQD
jgi:hypothetical protein